MRKYCLLLILSTLVSSCCTNKDTITYNFTTEEKAFLPYQAQSIIKWQNNSGDVFNGSTSDKKVLVKEISDYDCKSFEGEEINIYVTINNENYSISLEKRGSNDIDLNISQSVNGIPTRGFGVDVSHFGFTTIEFNNKTFNDAIELTAYGDGDVYLGTLIYSKTNGIEFILFEDGTWYKRVE